VNTRRASRSPLGSGSPPPPPALGWSASRFLAIAGTGPPLCGVSRRPASRTQHPPRLTHLPRFACGASIHRSSSSITSRAKRDTRATAPHERRLALRAEHQHGRSPPFQCRRFPNI
jgi:hypothetical protein